MSQHIEMLKKVSIFENADDAELGQISALLVERTFGKDTTIVTKDEAGDSMFLIARGRVKVVIQGDGGREVILNILKAGDFFGEMSLLDNLPRSADVVAFEDTRLLILKRDAFIEHLAKHPATALKIMGELSRRLRRADELISNLALLDVATRVAHIMIDLAKRDGEDGEDGILIRERPTQQDIASMIGTSRETVSRVLSDFQRAGLVEMRGREILLTRKFTTQTTARA